MEAYCIECEKTVKVSWEVEYDVGDYGEVNEIYVPRCSVCGSEIEMCMNCFYWKALNPDEPLFLSPHGECTVTNEKKHYMHLACEKYKAFSEGS